MARPPLPEYEPVPVHDQVREVRKQLEIVRNVLDRKVGRDEISPAAAAAELQTLQSAVRTLEAVEQVFGPSALVRGPGDLQRAA